MFIGSQPAGSERRNCVFVFIGSQPAWTEQLMETRPGIPRNVGNGILFIGRGLVYRKTEETDLCWSARAETGVLFIGRGVVYRKTEVTD